MTAKRKKQLRRRKKEQEGEQEEKKKSFRDSSLRFLCIPRARLLLRRFFFMKVRPGERESRSRNDCDGDVGMAKKKRTRFSTPKWNSASPLAVQKDCVVNHRILWTRSCDAGRLLCSSRRLFFRANNGDALCGSRDVFEATLRTC
jgi:hypothetical protein